MDVCCHMNLGMVRNGQKHVSAGVFDKIHSDNRLSLSYNRLLLHTQKIEKHKFGAVQSIALC